MKRTQWSSTIGFALLIFGVYLLVSELTSSLTASNIIGFTSGYMIVTGIVIVATTVRGKR